MLLESLDAQRRKAVGCEVAEVAHRFNRSSDGTMAVPADYLEVIAARRPVWRRCQVAHSRADSMLAG